MHLHYRVVMTGFFLVIASIPALGPSQPPIQWVQGVKHPEREDDQPLPHSAEVKNAWSYTSTPSICLHGMVLN